MWTQFWDMHSGGGLKEKSYDQIYIESPKEIAKLIFYNRFGHDPDRVDVSERPVEEPYILFLMHPVTTELDGVYEATRSTIEGIRQAWDGKIITIGPNHDAGHYEVWRAITDSGLSINSDGSIDEFAVLPNVDHETFVRLMAHAEVMVGNSSAGIREAGYFGTPVLDIGTRQQYREHGINVIQQMNSHYSFRNVKRLVKILLKTGRFEPEQIYGNGQAGTAIVSILATIDLPSIQKRIAY